jgi:phage FluMu protein gp41
MDPSVSFPLDLGFQLLEGRCVQQIKTINDPASFSDLTRIIHRDANTLDLQSKASFSCKYLQEPAVGFIRQVWLIRMF